MDEYTVDFVLKEDRGESPGRSASVKKHGKASVTEFTVRDGFRGRPGRASFATSNAGRLTGRTHQIRVHLRRRATPILNESVLRRRDAAAALRPQARLQGAVDERPLIARLALHAGSLTFTHPLTREPATLVSPLPKDF